jgi:AraC-like DNA-binding protein
MVNMRRQSEGEDFASGAMMRLIASGLARQGISVQVRVPGGARVSQAVKRDTLLSVLSVHGPEAVLRIADALQHIAPEPLTQALLKAQDVSDFFDRWRRMESFSHSRHEVVVETAGPSAFRLQHQARDLGPSPTQAETLLVAGVLAIFAERVVGGHLTFGPEGGRPWRRDGRWSKTLDASTAKRFLISGARAAANVAAYERPTGGSFVDALRAVLVADPVRRWTVDDLAVLFDVTPRTLQRRLTAGKTSFTRLVADARLQTAATYLCEGSGPSLAEVGFLSGYADQAHFTRSFSSAVGTTPLAYRNNFAS